MNLYRESSQESEIRVLVGCEYSNTVSQAFRDLGHDVTSCDLLPSEGPPEFHQRCDIMFLLYSGKRWDLGILHPDCTEMAVCGNRYHAGTQGREDAIEWTLRLWERAKKVCDRACLENPTSVIFPHLRKAGATVQYIQPYEVGHPETKKTGFALHNLDPLELDPADNVYEHMMTLPLKERHKIWYMSPGEDRGKERARFYPGFAKLMTQWAGE